MFSPTFRELYLKNLVLDSNHYQTPYYVLSDYRFGDSLANDSPNWESRFTAGIGNQLNHAITWQLLDSIAFETAPLGILFIYQCND
jgi:hypothetical protein